MTRRTLLDVATLIRDRIPGYDISTETRRGGAGGLAVSWCTVPGVYVVWAVAHVAPVSRRLVTPPGGRVRYAGRGWVERMAADIVAAVHEDARRHDRWGPERWEEVTRG